MGRPRRTVVRAAAILLLAALAAPQATGASAQTGRRGTVTPRQPFTWNGPAASGTNTGYDGGSGEPCGTEPSNYCDVTVLHVDVDASFWDSHGGGVEVSLKNYRPNSTSDFDLYIYKSDQEGRRGELVASSAGPPGQEESTAIPQASGYYLIQVVYWAVAQSQYTGAAEFVTRSKFPPDVDDPPGIEDHLVSDPARGFRSRSEPHIAQDPTDPRMLVAGSKMYNRDPDSLKEYEFKIGTYVSFDNGVTWTDLGQLAVCPASRAPPESWPDNVCYPEEDPTLGGIGPEDVDDPGDDEDPRDPRGSGDFAEEYITSDVWLQFDDEGNAYVMVLDAPEFETVDLPGVGAGEGWGMTLHRWTSVDPKDVEAGEPWSDRIVINSYDSGVEQNLFLDDKNTFAVNNAGRDGDGRTGIMVACWGQNVPPAIKQQIVCERSTDAGSTWPGEPVAISPPSQQLVLGVHVVADTRDQDTFYATWLHYVPDVVGLESELWVAKSVDGGRTWPQLSLAARLQGIPRSFPGQSFRNFSLPIMAVGPDGALYSTYAAYRDAPKPQQDVDGKQADVLLVRSTDGGLTWSQPVKVNQDATNADQFQPYVVVRPDGDLDVTFFDRRHDPENFFIDAFLARSSDQGKTWTETRLSHDMWDPSINPPISPSGHFIGDYQGLVADRCTTVAIVNDTHLANDASRDPTFDVGSPRSPFQELFTWRVPTGDCARRALTVARPSRASPAAPVGSNKTQPAPIPDTGGGAPLGLLALFLLTMFSRRPHRESVGRTRSWWMRGK